MNLKNIFSKLKEKEIPCYDLHTHTITKYTKTFDTNHKHGPILDVLKAAKNANFDAFGITDHLHEIVEYPSSKIKKTFINTSFQDPLNQYKKYIENLKDDYNLDIKSGVEIYVDKNDGLKNAPLNSLKTMDMILIETLNLDVDFSYLRKKFPHNNIILAHQDVEYVYGNKYNESMKKLIGDLERSDILFELNRQHMDKYIEDKNGVYRHFFEELKDKNIKFTIGSDYHIYPGDYSKLFKNILSFVNKYNLNGENFWRKI